MKIPLMDQFVFRLRFIRYTLGRGGRQGEPPSLDHPAHRPQATVDVALGCGIRRLEPRLAKSPSVRTISATALTRLTTGDVGDAPRTADCEVETKLGSADLGLKRLYIDWHSRSQMLWNWCVVSPPCIVLFRIAMFRDPSFGLTTG